MPCPRIRPTVRKAVIAALVVAFGLVCSATIRFEDVAKSIAKHRRPQPGTAFASVTSTSIIVENFPCMLRVRLDDPLAVGALQFRIDYRASGSTFIGNTPGSDCTALVGDFSSFNNTIDERVLDGAVVSIAGFTGPANLADCEFSPDASLPIPLGRLPEGVSLTATDASTPDLTPIAPVPALSGSTWCPWLGNTTTTLPPRACGAPVTGLAPPVTTDVLRILRAAIGLDSCLACLCDVDSNGSVDARDARRALLASLNLGDGLSCPGC